MEDKPALCSAVWTDVNSKPPPVKKYKGCLSPGEAVADSDVDDVTAFVSTVSSGLKNVAEKYSAGILNSTSLCEHAGRCGHGGCDVCDDEDTLFWTHAAEVLTQQEAAVATGTNKLSTHCSNSWDEDEELEASILFQELLAEELV